MASLSLSTAPRLGTNALPAPKHKARVKRIYAGDIKAAAGRERSGKGEEPWRIPGTVGSRAALPRWPWAPKEPNLHFHVSMGAILVKGTGLTPHVGLPSLPLP